MTARFGRRGGLLALLAGLSACAAQPEPAQPVVAAPSPDPEPERVYSPGAISWAELSDEHKRRATQGLARMGDPVDDEATLQARWMLMSPAQQRYLIRRPPPPAPARPAARTARGQPARRGTTSHTRGGSTQHRAATPQRGTTTQQRSRTPTPPRRPTNP